MSKKYLLLTIIVLFIMALFIVPRPTYALSCATPPSPDVAYDEADGVVIGTVTDIKRIMDRKIITVQVDKSFKGVDETSIQIHEDITWGESQLNMDYLYFLQQKGSTWVNTLCSSTTSDTSLADKFLINNDGVPLDKPSNNNFEENDLFKAKHSSEKTAIEKESEKKETIFTILAVLIISITSITIILIKGNKK